MLSFVRVVDIFLFILVDLFRIIVDGRKCAVRVLEKVDILLAVKNILLLNYILFVNNMSTFSKTRTAHFRPSTIIRNKSANIKRNISTTLTNDNTNAISATLTSDKPEDITNTIPDAPKRQIEKYFKTMHCVNLECRPDRWEQTVKEFEKLGPEYTLNRFDAIRDVKNPVAGTAKSFMTLIQMAKDQGMPAILVGEDDMTLYSKSAEMWEKSILELPDNWDILSGGMYYTQNRQKVSNTLCKVEDFACMHFICIRNTCYDKILSYSKDNMGRRHIDRFIGKIATQKKLNIYLTWPMISRQRASYSDLKKRDVNYNISCFNKELLFIS